MATDRAACLRRGRARASSRVRQSALASSPPSFSLLAALDPLSPRPLALGALPPWRLVPGGASECERHCGRSIRKHARQGDDVLTQAQWILHAPGLRLLAVAPQPPGMPDRADRGSPARPQPLRAPKSDRSPSVEGCHLKMVSVVTEPPFGQPLLDPIVQLGRPAVEGLPTSCR